MRSNRIYRCVIDDLALRADRALVKDGPEARVLIPCALAMALTEYRHEPDIRREAQAAALAGKDEVAVSAAWLRDQAANIIAAAEREDLCRRYAA